MFTGQTQLGGTDLESTQVLIGELLERSFSLGSDSEAVGAVLKRPRLPSKCIVVSQEKKKKSNLSCENGAAPAFLSQLKGSAVSLRTAVALI